MTREEAKQALAATSCFKQVGNLIALREVGLIEAVRIHEANCPPNISGTPTYKEVQPPRST